MDILMVDKIHKTFGNLKVLSDISFGVNKGDFVSILGASGCGKTTLLRIIAGLEKCESGSIFLNEKNITHLSASERNIGMVFQNFSLFPNMTVFQNIIYALKCGKKKTRIQSNPHLVHEIIQKCELCELIDRYPNQLSGGQQQRTAIARSLVLSPEILLLDEPFSALDTVLRQKLCKLMKYLQHNLGITIIYVTHDQEEAFTLSDKLIVMRKGVIQQSGRPEDIYNFPQNAYVMNFIHNQIKERYTNLCKIAYPAKLSE